METKMKYMALIYANKATDAVPGTDEYKELIMEYHAATKVYVDDGVLVAGDALESVNTATTIRKRKGKIETIDGPFAETKEQLGGYYVFDCKNLDDAIKYASMIPSAKYGSVEVRPIMTIEM